MGFWFSTDYVYRHPITLDFSTVNSIPANNDVEIVVPQDWDLFWDTIRSDFLDVVVTDVNGIVQQFQRKAGANYANKVLTLQLDNIQVPAANCRRWPAGSIRRALRDLQEGDVHVGVRGVLGGLGKGRAVGDQR